MLDVSPREAICAAAASGRLLRAVDLDVPHHALAHAEQAGVVERVVPGVYVGRDQIRHPLIEAAAWTLKHPSAVAGLLTAAAHHGLTDAFEGGTWLLVPLGTSPPRSRVVPVRVVQVAPWMIDPAQDVENGIQAIEVHGISVRVTGPDRTVLDLWRYAHLVSTEHALVGLRRRAGARDFHAAALARLARRLGTWSKVEPVLQGMMVR